MSVFTRFFNWIKRVFGGHKVLVQLIVEAATARFLAGNPRYAAMVISITTTALNAIASSLTLSLADLGPFMKSKINFSRLLPEEQALVSVFIDSIITEVTNDLAKENILNPAAQMVEVTQVLQWINAVAQRQK